MRVYHQLHLRGAIDGKAIPFLGRILCESRAGFENMPQIHTQSGRTHKLHLVGAIGWWLHLRGAIYGGGLGSREC